MKDFDERILRKFTVVTEKRGMERRLRIIQAAIDSLASVGIHSTTFDAVGKIAKMQRSHVAYYFKTHEELITAVIRFVIGSAQEVTIELVKAADTPRARLIAVVEGAFEQARRYPRHAIVMTMFWNLATWDPQYRILHTEVRLIGASRLEHILELIFQENKLKPERLVFLAKAVQAIVFGYLLEALSTNTFPTLTEAKDGAQEAVIRLVDSFAKSAR